MPVGVLKEMEIHFDRNSEKISAGLTKIRVRKLKFHAKEGRTESIEDP
jgi:hypothetical protein